MTELGWPASLRRLSFGVTFRYIPSLVIRRYTPLHSVTHRLLLEQPAVRNVGDLLLQHDDLLQTQVPLRELEARVRLNLERLVARLDLEHFVFAVGGELEGVGEARVDLAGEEGRPAGVVSLV